MIEIPVTRVKLFGIRILRMLMTPLLTRRTVTVARRGIRYELDLNEGIDFSIFLTGAFQRHLFELPGYRLPSDAVVVDVGANIGAVTLNFASRVPGGHVYAVEPTDYAFEKLGHNLDLNPVLKERVTTVKAFLTAKAGASISRQVYARWPIAAGAGEARHRIHGGIAEASSQVATTTLDDLVDEWGLSRLDLIKIDTDGHEMEVLEGAKRTLARFHPRIVFEVGAYLLAEKGLSPESFLGFFDRSEYRVQELKSGRAVDTANFHKFVPRNGTTDLLASWKRS